MPRYKADVAPAFILNGEQPAPGERERQAYARLLTASPQFARATVNLFWAELMGRGIVDPPFAFDLERQDPKNPPPAPWTIQPSHPELLNALAEDFQKHGYDLRYLMKLITKSNAYRLSADFGQKWNEKYDDYFARRVVRRLGPEQFWDYLLSRRYGELQRSLPSSIRTSSESTFCKPTIWILRQTTGWRDFWSALARPIAKMGSRRTNRASFRQRIC